MSENDQLGVAAAKAIEQYPSLIRFQLRLRVVTERALGILFANSHPDDNLTWLPLSQILIQNEWWYEGERYVSGKMPRWLAQAINLDLVE